MGDKFVDTDLLLLQYIFRENKSLPIIYMLVSSTGNGAANASSSMKLFYPNPVSQDY